MTRRNLFSTLTLAALAAISVLGCGGGGGGSTTNPTPTPGATPTPGPSPSPSPTPAPQGATGRVRYSDGTNVVEVNGDGTGKVTIGPARRNGALSPDGAQVVYLGSTTIGGFTELYIENVDGTNTRRLGVGTSGAQAHWSPDGTTIAYAANGAPVTNGSLTSTSPELWTVNPDGTNARQRTVSLSAGYGGDFDWSPDGTKFVFAAFIGGQQRAYIVNADGTGVHRLFDDNFSGPERDVVWTKSNKIYVRSLRVSFSLNRINPDGTGYQSVPGEVPGTFPDTNSYVISPDDKFAAFIKDNDLNVLRLSDGSFTKIATGGSLVDWR